MKRVAFALLLLKKMEASPYPPPKEGGNLTGRGGEGRLSIWLLLHDFLDFGIGAVEALGAKLDELL